MSNNDQEYDRDLMLALTAMASLPQWPVFVQAFKSRNDDWNEDESRPPVYQNHAELVQVTARAAENRYWIEIFESAEKKATEPDSRV